MKIVFISSMLPSGHFSQILTNALQRLSDINLIIYADKNPQNLKIKGCGKIKTVWSKNAFYALQIIHAVRQDKPDLIHLQQEFSMYGGLLTAFLFPILIFILRILGYKTVVTIHAAVFRHEVTNDFISFFLIKKSVFAKPLLLKFFFYYVYGLTSFFAYKIICHNNLMKKILVEDWKVNPKKLHVIPTIVPEIKKIKTKKEKYFFCFGYLTRRKGFENVLSGYAKFAQKNKNYKLIVAGGSIAGQEKALHEIFQFIKKLDIDKNVDIRGFVEEKAIQKLYLAASAVIIPAKITMGSSGPLYHAQSYGKCILASRIGHLQEDIKNMTDGILVDNNKWDEGFQFVVDNPQKIAEIERNVAMRAKEKSSENIGIKYLNLYES